MNCRSEKHQSPQGVGDTIVQSIGCLQRLRCISSEKHQSPQGVGDLLRQLNVRARSDTAQRSINPRKGSETGSSRIIIRIRHRQLDQHSEKHQSPQGVGDILYVMVSTIGMRRSEKHQSPQGVGDICTDCHEIHQLSCSSEKHQSPQGVGDISLTVPAELIFGIQLREASIPARRVGPVRTGYARAEKKRNQSFDWLRWSLGAHEPGQPLRASRSRMRLRKRKLMSV